MTEAGLDMEKATLQVPAPGSVGVRDLLKPEMEADFLLEVLARVEIDMEGRGDAEGGCLKLMIG